MVGPVNAFEELRSARMKWGHDELRGARTGKLVFHHESYRPERGLHVLADTHHDIHFQPHHLDDREKERLLICRHGALAWMGMCRVPGQREKLIKEYRPPGRKREMSGVRVRLLRR